MSATCETCRWWKEDGLWPRCECRRHAPVLVSDARPYRDAEWPRTNIHDSCGDHEPKPEKAKEPAPEA